MQGRVRRVETRVDRLPHVARVIVLEGECTALRVRGRREAREARVSERPGLSADVVLPLKLPALTYLCQVPQRVVGVGGGLHGAAVREVDGAAGRVRLVHADDLPERVPLAAPRPPVLIG